MDEHPNVFDVRNDSGHQVAGMMPVMERETQALSVVVELLSDVVDDALG